MALIGVEEHWTTGELTAALRGLPGGARDERLVCNEMGDKAAKLEDIGRGRIAVMDEQGISTGYPFERPSRHEVRWFMTVFDGDEQCDKFRADNARRPFGIA